MFTVDGLVSGLDTTAIVEGALASQQARLDRLNFRKQEVVNEQTLFQSIEGQLLGLQGSLRKILRSSNNAFDSKVAASSDEDSVAVTASSNAATGTYRIRATQLAQAHQLKSNGFSSKSEEINRGTFTLQVGNRAETKVIIDETNNTFQGLADAINAQSNDVQAAIINDGSNSDQPYRLLLTSRHTGSQNEINLTNSLGSRRRRGGSNSASQPDFSGPVVQEARDAQVQIGNGAGAITVSSHENQFDDLIPGVTLDTLKVDPEKEIVITVSEDSSEVVDAVEGFVSAYNEVIDFIDANSKFDPESNSAGLLLGNRPAASVQSTLRAAIGTVVNGVNKKLRTATAVGISTDADGKLNLNRAKLQDILNGREEGVGLDDIRRLFAIDGQSDNRGVEFLLGTNKTQASPIDPESGSLIPYEVEINRVATRAHVQSTTSLLNNIVFDETNDTFTFEIDNTTLSIQIPHGTYQRDAVADQLQTLISTAPDRAGRQATVELIDEQLSITSDTYGGASTLKILDGSANAALGLVDGQSSKGVDVAGVFRVQLPGNEKITEQAKGSGQILSSDAKNEYTADLQVRSTLQPNQIGAATDASLTVTRGIGATIDAAISELLRDERVDDRDIKGVLASTQDRFDLQIEAIDDNIERVEAQLEARRESILREFAALESTLAELQSIGTALSSNLATLTL